MCRQIIACTPPSLGQSAGEPERDRVTVDVPVPRERAVGRTVAALLTESLSVARNEGGLVTAEPIWKKPITSHYRAMYVPFWQRVERIATGLR